MDYNRNLALDNGSSVKSQTIYETKENYISGVSMLYVYVSDLRLNQRKLEHCNSGVA
jgi:hypothetical protein